MDKIIYTNQKETAVSEKKCEETQVEDIQNFVFFSEDRPRTKYSTLKRALSFKNPKEKTRGLYYLELIEKYGYPESVIEFDVKLPENNPQKTADIVIYEDCRKRETYAIIQCLGENASNEDFEKAFKEASDISKLTDAYFAICVSGARHRIIETTALDDINNENTAVSDLPVSYSRLKELNYRKGDKVFNLKENSKNEIQKILEKIARELSGEKGEKKEFADAEIEKICRAKIFDENTTEENGAYNFQIRSYESRKDLLKRINELYLSSKQPEENLEPIKLTTDELANIVEQIEMYSFSDMKF